MKRKHKILIPVIIILYAILYTLHWQRDVRQIMTPGRRVTSHSPEMRRLMQKKKVDNFLSKFRREDGR